jgi:hypothetical protein
MEDKKGGRAIIFRDPMLIQYFKINSPRIMYLSKF